jgi:hypothetical protein
VGAQCRSVGRTIALGVVRMAMEGIPHGAIVAVDSAPINYLLPRRSPEIRRALAPFSEATEVVDIELAGTRQRAVPKGCISATSSSSLSPQPLPHDHRLCCRRKQS